MKPLEKAWFFHVPSEKKQRKLKVKSFTNEKEMKDFTKWLREKGRYYTYSRQEGNQEVVVNGQLSLLEANTTKNVLHIIKYI